MEEAKEGTKGIPGRGDSMNKGMGHCQPVRVCLAATPSEGQLEAHGGGGDNLCSNCCEGVKPANNHGVLFALPFHR